MRRGRENSIFVNLFCLTIQQLSPPLAALLSL
uniref:Uncharacterized protein n=1 Tax=Myoviridae sp. ctI7W9 TaxID=2826636 RepID=A0A8S5MNZ8_9CAUD|nr:MAG TPA: hypothetical protein [Myoviridae sp. ctI7W9]